MLAPDVPPPGPGDEADAGADELASRRARRFARGGPPDHYECPSCGAHAAFGGLCLVCGDAQTRPVDASGRRLPPA